MLVVEGTYENGELHLDSPVSYPQPMRVRVEFLDERTPMAHSRFSWDKALARGAGVRGTSAAEEVIAERNERG